MENLENRTMMNTRTLGTSIDRMLTLNRALDQAFNGIGTARVWVPALDVAERGDAYVVHAELPGVSPDQVDVRFSRGCDQSRGGIGGGRRTGSRPRSTGRLGR